jgi:hypothetical protein
LNGDAGRVVDLAIEFSALDDEDVRPMTTVALLLTLALGREAGTVGMVDGGVVFKGE